MTRAFTLIETIIVIALFAIMMSALAALYLSFGTSTAFQKSLADSTTRAGRALALLHTDISQSSSVLASHSFSSGTTYFSSSNGLVLALPSEDGSGTVISGSFDYVAYYLSGTDLHRIIEADAASSRHSGAELIASGVSSLTFAYDNADYTQAERIATDLIIVTSGRTAATSEVRDTSYMRNHI